MTVRVITPPEPIVTPVDIAGNHAANDAAVTAMIQAVTEQIDGPDGWLGRALGTQTLELTQAHFCEWLKLPCPPIIIISSVKYLDSGEAEQTLAPSEYRVIGSRLYFRGGFEAPAVLRAPDAVRIRYKAGFNGTSGAGEGEVQTGAVPERARQAIIMSVQHMMSLNMPNLFLRSDEVVGVGTKQYTVSEVAGKIISDTCDRLLAGLKVYSL